MPQNGRLEIKNINIAAERLGNALSALKAKGLEGLILSDIKNVRYIFGFTGSSAYALISEQGSFFLTDQRYATQLKSEVRGFTKTIVYKKALDAITGLAAGLKIKRLGFEGAHLSFDSYKKIKDAVKGITLVAASGTVEGLRARKDKGELNLIQKAIEIAEAGFGEIEQCIAKGVLERDAALKMEFAMRRAGAEDEAFETIVASGQRGALPHGSATGKRIKKGELVVVDAGARFSGYNSDMTRTYCCGKADREQRKVYNAVLSAQQRAIEKIRSGIDAKEIDRAARDCIKKAGYGKYFCHGTGHGVGLDVHERPSIGPESKDVLQDNMVITVEPGVYIPGWGGVRIEDMVLVKGDGCEVLTKSTTREMVCL